MKIVTETADGSHYCQRQHNRADVKIGAQIRASGGLRNHVRLIDLSRAGFQMECLAFIPDDRPIFLTMPGFMPLECSVAWHVNWKYGCAFASPLHDAIYDHIIKAYPALVA